MNAFSLCAGLAAAFVLGGGLASAAPIPDLDKDPAGFLRFYARYVQTAPSPEVRAIRRNVAAGPAALARERALARREGLAVAPAQLNRPLPPDDQNAAPLYRKAEALRRGRLRLPNYAETLSASFAYTPVQLDRVQKIYDDNSEAITLLHQATDRPQCVFARDPATNTPDFPFQRMRETARELKTESVLQAERGQYTAAITTGARVYRVAEHTASEPTLIPYLVAVAVDAIATSGMQDVLALAGPNADVDAQVERAMMESSARLSLRHALSGEAALGDASFSLLRRGGPAALGSFLNDTPAPPHPAAFTPSDRRFYSNLLDASEANYLHKIRAIVPLADTPDAAAAFARAGREAHTPTGDLTQDVARLLSPFQPGPLSDLPVRSAVSRAVTRAAAAVLAARARTGAYPAALPGAFADPYTGKPLGYRREGADGFVIFSVGPDGKYDGGRPGDRAGYAIARNRFRYPTVRVPVPPEDLK